MSEEYADLSYMSEKRTPITASLYYFDRWKISQCKMLLNDLQYLELKHGIPAAGDLYQSVQDETQELCRTLDNIIQAKQEGRKQLAE